MSGRFFFSMALIRDEFPPCLGPQAGQGTDATAHPPSLPFSGLGRPAWRCDKCVLNCSEADLSPKLMIIITLHEKSILERRAREGRERGRESLHHVCQQG